VLGLFAEDADERVGDLTDDRPFCSGVTPSLVMRTLT
jgi:hypothetical protein